jgi:hypothetical protein
VFERFWCENGNFTEKAVLFSQRIMKNCDCSKASVVNFDASVRSKLSSRRVDGTTREQSRSQSHQKNNERGEITKQLENMDE